MKRYLVAYEDQAIADLMAIEKFISEKSSFAIGRGYAERLKAACDALYMAPKRGTKRNDLGPNYARSDLNAAP